MPHDIIVIIVQVISVGLTYYFGRKSATNDLKTKTLSKRYKKAYVPYIKTLYAGFMIEDVRDIPIDARSKFFDILSHNLEYWDDETLRLYPVFYQTFLDMLEYKNGDSGYAHAPAAFRKAWRAISLSILKHSQSIARELYMPPIGAALYENYRHNAQKPPTPQA